jgi:hypothetical protein
VCARHFGRAQHAHKSLRSSHSQLVKSTVTLKTIAVINFFKFLSIKQCFPANSPQALDDDCPAGL